jgi:phenylacetate-CoA ligase
VQEGCVVVNRLGIYFQLPAVAQNVLVSIAGVGVRRKRYGTLFRRRLAEYEERDLWDSEFLSILGKTRRAAALERASRTPYYQSVFNKMGATWRDLVEDSAFIEIPMTHKSDVRDRPDEFLARPWTRGDSLVRTSGTTGSSLVIQKDVNAIAEQWAVWWRYRHWHGIARGTWCAFFGGNPIMDEGQGMPYWRTNHPGREVRFSVSHISLATVQCYVDKLNRLRLPWIHGIPSAIANFARCMLEQRVGLDYQPRVITVGSENLMPWQARTIQAAFGVTPIQHYGLAEQAANISECVEGRLHIDEDFADVELVDQGGGLSQIVGTPYANKATMLLRYATGDLATAGEHHCACGRAGRVVASVDGRQNDILVLSDGRILGFPGVPFNKPGIELAEAQVVQHENGSLTVRYVPSAAWSASSLEALHRSFRKFVGPGVEVNYVHVDQVQRTPTGKVRLVISEVRGSDRASQLSSSLNGRDAASPAPLLSGGLDARP